MQNTYTSRERNAYFLGVLGQNILYAVISTGLSYYFQSVIFLPVFAISVIFTISKIFDALKDPIMGTLIDCTHSKWGKCRPYLIFSPIIICLFTIISFTNGTYSSSNSSLANAVIIAFASISYLLWGVAFTLGDVPMWTLPSLMTDDENDRNRLMGLARSAASIGASIVVVSIVPFAQALGNVISEPLGNNEKGLKYAVIIVATALTVIGTSLFQLTGFFTKERVIQAYNKKSSIKRSFQMMWSCKPFRQIMASGILRSPFFLLNTVQMTLFSYYYGDNGRTPYIFYFVLLGGGNMFSQLVSAVITPKLTAKFQKEKLYRIFSIVTAAPYFSIFILYMIAPGELDNLLYLFIFFVLMVIAGFGQGIIQVLQSIMIADTVDFEEYNTGHRPDGVFFSGQSLLTKLSSGVASIISGIVYSIAGFSGDNIREVNDALFLGASFKDDPQFAKYRFAIFFLFSIPPAIGMLVSLLPMRKYALSDDEHSRILNLLNKKRDDNFGKKND